MNKARHSERKVPTGIVISNWVWLFKSLTDYRNSWKLEGLSGTVCLFTMAIHGLAAYFYTLSCYT